MLLEQFMNVHIRVCAEKVKESGMGKTESCRAPSKNSIPPSDMRNWVIKYLLGRKSLVKFVFNTGALLVDIEG